LRNIGVYSTNTILKKLRENPIPENEGGDVLTVQMAMTNLKTLLPGAANDGGAGETDPETDPQEPDGTQPFDRIVAPYRNLFRDVAGRLSRAKKPEPAFARKLVHPLVASMAQAMLALRFGNCELTQREQERIDAATDLVLAAGVSARSARVAFAELSKEIS
jgi:hypothetical protein